MRSRNNIHVFRQFIKRIVTFTERHSTIFRSCFFALPLTLNSVFASFDALPFSARHAALAGAGVAWCSGADGIYVNAACLHGASPFDLHFFYAKPYGLHDLNMANVAARYSRARCSCGIGIQYFGNDLYRENQFLAAVAIPISPALLLALSGRLGILNVQHHGQAHSVLADFGVIVRLTANAAFGFSAKNVANAKVGAAHEPLPSSLIVGVHMTPFSHCVVDFDLCKEIRFPLDVRCGISWQAFSALTLRMGVGGEPSRVCAGFTLCHFRVRLDYAFSTHSELGLTHLFSVGVY
ncbi:hypothetical protein JXA02_10755 [candidate division KSB1 bacterium]|nr:hypothetical protein [candidate division KSB1 bacterium]RQW03065.1 MAG: hypothetical protein EH222_12850 [candidate division KSB1 bacterium]